MSLNLILSQIQTKLAGFHALKALIDRKLFFELVTDPIDY